MWEALRKIMVFVLVLAVSAAIYLLFYARGETRLNVLEQSLNLMGDKLLAMVPDGAEKERLVSYNRDEMG